jgi:endogenous inhibitor of DNA gyrase (YacG/DUF329 family)
MIITKPCETCGVTYTRCITAKQVTRFCSRACANKDPNRVSAEAKKRQGRSGTEHHNFKGGQFTGDGRFQVWLPPEERAKHPTGSARGYILRYHLVWNEAHPDDPVLPGQIIHHLNDDSTDDRIENLAKMTQSEHARAHDFGHHPGARRGF